MATLFDLRKSFSRAFVPAHYPSTDRVTTCPGKLPSCRGSFSSWEARDVLKDATRPATVGVRGEPQDH
jgi:hypothetical protein